VRVVLGAVERLPAVVGDLGDLLQAPLRHIGEPREVQGHGGQAGMSSSRLQNMPAERVLHFVGSERRVLLLCELISISSLITPNVVCPLNTTEPDNSV